MCSGIEAATVAWEPLGWEPVAFSEIEKFPCAVLAHRHPDVPNRGDTTKFKEWPNDAKVNVLVGGTPCQSFSVAGFRKGLDDPRGNLMLTFLAIAQRCRPDWVVWENVPGVLSTNKGRDFGAFLGGLAELRYGWAYRILDAQYFGVPQRRRRVFVIGHSSGQFHRAAAVLFDRKSLLRYPPPSRKVGEEITKTLRAQSQSSHREDLETFAVIMAHGQGGAENSRDRSPALTCNHEATIAFHPRQDPITIEGISLPLEAQNGQAILTAFIVRRLMPVEHERLQGFPDHYTRIPWRGKSADVCPDGPRYRALGNSMAVPVMRWIGDRIKVAETLTPSNP